VLTIRQSQMDALNEHALESFFQRACAFLREYARDDLARLDDQRLLAGVRQAYKTAARHGIVTEQGAMLWMCLQVMTGGKFYEMPEMAELLKNGRTPEDALRDVYDRLSVLETRRGNPA
jgi:hypothetical protein